MQPLFSTAAKLLGLYLFFQMLLYMVPLTLFARDTVPQTPVLTQLLMAATPLAFSLFLIFGTERLARLVRAPAEASGLEIHSDVALKWGMVLIGIIVLTTRLGPAIQSLSYGQPAFGGSRLRLFFEWIPVVLALILILAPGAVAKIVRPARLEGEYES